MALVDDAKSAVNRNVDMKIVVSVAVGVALFGLSIYALKKSGVKPLKKVAAVVSQ